MKKITFNKWIIVSKTFRILTGGIFVLWLFGIAIQSINSFLHQEYSMYLIYGQIALTLFGFTLIGGIFEKKRNPSEIVKKLFDSSISFLTVAIAFFFMYSMSSVFTKDMIPMDAIPTALVVGSFSLAMMIGFYGIILGFLNLYQILIDYRMTFDKK